MKHLALALALSIAAIAPAHADPEANKKVVLDFYEKGLNQKDFEAAAKHFGPKYIQHNPTAPDGIEGFKAFIADHMERRRLDQVVRHLDIDLFPIIECRQRAPVRVSG